MTAKGKNFGIAGIDIHLVRDGRLAEYWHVVDQLAQMLNRNPFTGTPIGVIR